jgi:TPR repeat protein
MRTFTLLCVLLALSACNRDPAATIAARDKSPSAKAVSVTTGDDNPEPTGPGAHHLKAGQGAYAVGDHERALNFFRDAAQAGNADAQFYTGLMYAEGEGTRRSYAEAAKWYEMAAAQNQPDALYALAKLYVIGSGVPSDSGRALELFRRAEEHYPPGEKRDEVAEQRAALEAVLKESQTAQAPTDGGAAKKSP